MKRSRSTKVRIKLERRRRHLRGKSKPTTHRQALPLAKAAELRYQANRKAEDSKQCFERADAKADRSAVNIAGFPRSIKDDAEQATADALAHAFDDDAHEYEVAEAAAFTLYRACKVRADFAWNRHQAAEREAKRARGVRDADMKAAAEAERVYSDSLRAANTPPRPPRIRRAVVRRVAPRARARRRRSVRTASRGSPSSSDGSSSDPPSSDHSHASAVQS